MSLGQQVELVDMRAEVAALTRDGRPLEAQIHFAQPLDDPSLKWLQWDWKKNAYVPFTPPAIGETVWTDGPFDLD